MNLDIIRTALDGKRFPLEDEKQTQAAIYDALSAANLRVDREVSVAGGVIDFVVTVSDPFPPPCRGFRIRRIGIEAKIRGTRRGIVRQMIRYAADPGLCALVLVTSKPVTLGPMFATKPALVIDLGKAWL